MPISQLKEIHFPKRIICCAHLGRGRPSLQIGLSIQCGGEGHVVEGALDGVGAGVGLHPLDAVLGLVRRQLAPQLLGKNVGLKKREEISNWVFTF